MVNSCYYYHLFIAFIYPRSIFKTQSTYLSAFEFKQRKIDSKTGVQGLLTKVLLQIKLHRNSCRNPLMNYLNAIIFVFLALGILTLGSIEFTFIFVSYSISATNRTLKIIFQSSGIITIIILKRCSSINRKTNFICGWRWKENICVDI